MKRTTIMLPVDLRLRAAQTANRMGVSLGELVRESLNALLIRTKEKDAQDSLFSDKAVFRGNSPKDLAKRHDAYLYGDP